ncbi:MAG: hypothetical protein R2688_08910, partial [Fimbriimonadaceae bacterium]
PRLLKEMEEDGVPTTAEEIAPPMPPDEENAAVLLNPAFKYYYTHKEPIDADAKVFSTNKDIPANHKLSKETEEYLEMSHLAFQRPKMVFERDYSDPINTMFPEFAPTKLLTKLHGLDMRLAARRGDWARARKNAETLVSICNFTAGEPSLIGALVCIADRAITLADIGKLLGEVQDTEAALDLAQYVSDNMIELNILDPIDFESYTHYFLCSSDQPINMGELSGGREPSPIPHTTYGRILKARVLEKHLELRKIYKENYNNWPKLRKELHTYVKAMDNLSPDYTLAVILGPTYTSIVDAYMKDKQLHQVLAVTIKIHEYKLKNGSFPPADSNLIEDELFTEGKLNYIPSKEGFKLYSVGWDGMDNGGIEVKKKPGDESQYGGDVVYTFRAPKSELRFMRNASEGNLLPGNIHP